MNHFIRLYQITCIELITGNYGLCHNESRERINPYQKTKNFIFTH